MTTTKNNEHKKLNFSSEREQSQVCLNSAEHEKNQGRKVLNVPNLRFKEFQGEWINCTIGEIGTIKNGPFGSVLHAEDYVDEGMPIVTTEHFKSGCLPFSKDGIPQVSEDDYKRLRGYKLEKDDIVFSRVGSVDINAHVGALQDGWLFSGRVLRVRPIKTINAECLHYVLSTELVKRNIRNRAVGQTMPSINTPILANTKIFLPQSIVEQKKIATLLRLIDERIATQNKIIEDLKKLKSAIIEEYYRQTEKNEVCVADLGNHFNVGNLAKDDLSETGKPCIIYGELFTTYGEIISQIESHTNKTGGMILSKKGDLLFPSSTTVDAVSLIAPSVINVDNVILGGDMFGIHISHNYNAQYLSYYFNHIAKKQLAKFAKGSTIIHLHYTDIEKAKLLLPSLEEQNRMAKCLVALDKKVSVEQNLLSSLTCQKSYLLQQMFI